MRTALYLMAFEASKILKILQKNQKSFKAALQLCAGCASLGRTVLTGYLQCDPILNEFEICFWVVFSRGVILTGHLECDYVFYH